MTMIAGATSGQTTDEGKNAATEQTQQQSGTAGSSASTDTKSAADSTTEAFDAESLEISFGLPPGSLKDVKDEASALAAVKAFTDKTLLAGLEAIGTTVADEGKTTTTTTGATTPTVTKPAEKKADTPDGQASLLQRLEALEARDKEREKELSEYKAAEKQRVLSEIDKRFLAEVDSWASPKYGVTGTRTYAQTKALKELRDELVPNYVGGRKAAGLQIPPVEAVARSVRAAHDPEGFTAFVQQVQKKQHEKAGAVGTPGQRKDTSGEGDKPRSIHHAVLTQK